LAHAVWLAALLIKSVREPHRYADRIAGPPCITCGIHVLIVPSLIVAAGFTLVLLLATAVALRRLERISRPDSQLIP
jgi:hypothetical protein